MVCMVAYAPKPCSNYKGPLKVRFRLQGFEARKLPLKGSWDLVAGMTSRATTEKLLFTSIFRGLGFRLRTSKARFPSRTLLPFFFLASLIKTK